MTIRRTLSLSALVTATTLVLVGCAAGSAFPAGSPSETGGTQVLDVSAGWLDGGRAVAVVTHGSSSCVPSASDVSVHADGSVAVTLVDPTGEAVCTADLAPRASLVSLPNGVDAAAKLSLTVSLGTARGQVTLEPYAGPAVAEYAPSAGWIDGNALAILTWGSSSCALRVQSAVSTGTDVAVTFVDPPADRACTMDMAPRIALAVVDGGGAASGATATLSGGDAQFATPVTIPIAG